MSFLDRFKKPVAINREVLFSGNGGPIEGYEELLQANQLIERTLAFVKFKKKNPNPFESMNEFIVHCVDSYSRFNGVTIVKSGAYYYVADSLQNLEGMGWQFTSNILEGVPFTLTDRVGNNDIKTIKSATLSSIMRVEPQTNNLIKNAIVTVLRRLSSLGRISLVWQRKGNQALNTRKNADNETLEVMNELTNSSGGVMTAGIDDKFFQVQPDYSKADGTEVAGSIALFSYVTGLSPEFLRGAQSDQQLVQTVLQLIKPFLDTLSEKIEYFNYSFTFDELATLKQSQAKSNPTTAKTNLHVMSQPEKEGTNERTT